MKLSRSVRAAILALAASVVFGGCAQIVDALGLKGAKGQNGMDAVSLVPIIGTQVYLTGPNNGATQFYNDGTSDLTLNNANGGGGSAITTLTLTNTSALQLTIESVTGLGGNYLIGGTGTNIVSSSVPEMIAASPAGAILAPTNGTAGFDITLTDLGNPYALDTKRFRILL
jgi:hypothetical protein